MRKFIYLATFCVVVALTACNKEEHLDTNGIPDMSYLDNLSEDELRIEAAKLGAVTERQLIEEAAKSIVTVDNDSTTDNPESSTLSFTEKGYTSMSALSKNQKAVISKSDKLATGVYFVDVVRIYKLANIPNGSLGISMDSPKCGYGASSYRGYTATQSGTRFHMYTIGYQVKHNIIGQTVGEIWAPFSSPEKIEWMVGYMK